jgi:hypothetical protein
MKLSDMKRCVILGFVHAIFAAGVFCASAATFNVSTLTDSGPGSLRQAILDANATPGNDTITFSVTGTITLTTNLPDVTDNTAFMGPGTNLLTISGSNTYRIFYLTSATNSLSDLTIAQGCALPNTWPYVGIGSSYTNASGVCSRGALTMLRCVVRDCTNVYSFGAGIYNGGNLEMRGCSVTRCRGLTRDGYDAQVDGAGLYNDGMASLTDSCIASCGGSVGNGIYTTGSLFMTNSTIYDCWGRAPYPDGGGIAAVSAKCATTLNNCLITQCRGYWGGGLEVSGNLTMINSCVISNRADSGGGILNWGSGTLIGCTISGNSCSAPRAAGGVINLGNMEMRNCTLSQNSAPVPVIGDIGPTNQNPAAAFSDRAIGGGKLSLATYLDHCTIVSNTGLFQIMCDSTNFHAANSILADCYGTNISGGHNLIANTNGTSTQGDETGNLYQVDPLLGPLQNNGGPTPTHALLPGSPAIDHADAGSVTTDQRGAARSGVSDIGAYELVSVTPPNLQISASGPGQLTLYWPSTNGPALLQQNAGLDGAGWLDVGTYPMDDGTTTSLVLPADAAQGFFRLRSP